MLDLQSKEKEFMANASIEEQEEFLEEQKPLHHQI